MNREQLAHILRAAARVTDDPEIVVIGSQAILGTWDDDELPEEATLSVEADVAFRVDPDEAKADAVDGAIGELSAFHETFGYYGQGVVVKTATLPEGWEDRVVAFDRADADPASGVCVEAHDLVISKLVAGREKDRSFATALIHAELLDVTLLLERAGQIPMPEAVKERVRDQVRHCARQKPPKS